jgi:hypothetical protein
VPDSSKNWLKASSFAYTTGGEQFFSPPNSIKIEATKNSNVEFRKSIITIKNDIGENVEIELIQSGGDPQINTSLSYLSFSASASGNKFTVSSNTAWTVSSNQNWCTVTTQGNEVLVTVDENKSGTNRSAIITVAVSDEVKTTVNVTQSKPMLSTSNSEILFSASVSQKTFTVSSDVAWAVSSNQNWCTVTSLGNRVTVEVDENRSATDRSAIITVAVSDEVKTTVNVTQSKPTFSTSNSELTFPKTPTNSQTITVTSNISGWEASSNQNWCTVSRNNNILTINADANNTGNIRQAIITILGQPVTTVYQDAYQVGDYYNQGGVQGVVFTMTGKGHGQIVSMDETSIQWSISPSITSASSSADGLTNMNTIKAMTNWETAFPAFGWCGAKNTGGITGWYFPAISEVSDILNKNAVINVTMQQFGGTVIDIDRVYWTSTERDSDQAYYFYYSGTPFYGTPGFVYSYSGGWKTNTHKVRAVKMF